MNKVLKGLIEFARTLRGLTLTLFGVTLLILMLIIVGGVYAFVTITERQSWQERQTTAAEDVSHSLVAFLQRQRDFLGFINVLEDTPHDDADQDVYQTWNDKLLAENPAIQELLMVNDDGSIHANIYRDASVLANLFTIQQSNWFINARKGEFFISQLQFTADNEPYVIMSRPIDEGGVAAIRVRMDVLSSEIAESKLGQTGNTYVANLQGQVLFHTEFRLVEENTVVESRPEFILSLQSATNSWSGAYTNFEGEQVEGTALHLPDYDLVIFTEVSQSEAFANSRSALLVLGGITLGFWGVTMLLSTGFLQRFVFQPLERLQIGTEQIERGNLNYRVPVIRQDEIGQVSETFNAMSNRLQARDAEIAANTAERETLLHQTGNLYQITRELSTVITQEELLRVASYTPYANGAQNGALMQVVLDSDKKPAWIEVVAVWRGSKARAGLPMRTRLSLDDPYSQRWIENPSQAYLVPNVGTQERITEAARQMLLGIGMNAFIIIPLQQADRLLGIIAYTWPEPHDFTAEEISIYNALPALVSPVAENIRLLENLEQTVEDLVIAKRIADENSRLKSEFLSTMSHELRTPLNAIEGFTSILLNNMGVELAPKARGMIERVSSNSKRLLHLINDFLDLTRIESGRLQLVSLPISPNKLAERWRGQVGVLAEQKDVALLVEVDPQLPDTLYGDEDALTKITVNLLSNAFKFTQQGHVSLKLGHVDESTWSITVSDTGIGIPLHAREYIFEEFRQVDGSSKREFGGTGLGLAIVQKLSRALGGTVTLESEMGEGSTFTVVLPLAHEPEPELT